MKTITKNDIKNVWFTDEAIHIETTDGKQAKEMFSEFPRLKFASQEQRKQYSLGHFGIHWKLLDEDLSYDGFFSEKTEKNQITETFKNLYGINVSAIARRAGLPQSLMASYVSGIKNPSDERKKEIENVLHQLGKELMAVSF
jgi:cell division protein FtsI/penicillin-binding protein 2